MPVAVLVGVGSSHVLGGAQTNIHGLNGPLELRQQDVVGRLKDASALEAVNANQAESNTLDVNVVTIIPTSSGYFFPVSWVTTLLKGNIRLRMV